MNETVYRIGIPGPNVEYLVDEDNQVLTFDDEKAATAKLADLSEEYQVIPFTHHEAGE